MVNLLYLLPKRGGVGGNKGGGGGGGGGGGPVPRPTHLLVERPKPPKNPPKTPLQAV